MDAISSSFLQYTFCTGRFFTGYTTFLAYIVLPDTSILQFPAPITVARTVSSPDMLGSGAVIITGESAKKRNARMVTESIAELAGEFVVASAGPDLESLLPGKGSGAALSQNEQIISE